MCRVGLIVLAICELFVLNMHTFASGLYNILGKDLVFPALFACPSCPVHFSFWHLYTFTFNYHSISVVFSVVNKD
jgi:hypothetical protein